jgi:hypothetical protein
VVSSAAFAQDFGVMESAETIDRGNFKLKVNPLLVFGKHGRDDEPGVAVELGYGFTKMFDLEGGVAIYDGISFFGGNAEFWLVKRRPIDFSIIAGLHVARGDKTLDTTGVDLTFLASKHVTSKLDLYGAIDLDFESVTERHIDDSFTRAHLVPGLEYRVRRDIDLLAEIGIAVNDNSSHYISGGIAFYFR